MEKTKLQMFRVTAEEFPEYSDNGAAARALVREFQVEDQMAAMHRMADLCYESGWNMPHVSFRVQSLAKRR